MAGDDSFQSKSIVKKKSVDQVPSSPEDGEITDEDMSLEENCVEVRLTITILTYLFLILITDYLVLNVIGYFKITCIVLIMKII